MDKETYLTFELGRELFAVNVKNVLEVLEQQQITKVPKAPEHILGIINFRGEILPVVNTRSKFHLSENDPAQKPLMIVYQLRQATNGMVSVAATADGVKDVIEILPDEIKPVPEMGLSYDARYVLGAIRRNDHFILLIEPEKVFLQTEIDAANQIDTIESMKE